MGCDSLIQKTNRISYTNFFCRSNNQISLSCISLYQHRCIKTMRRIRMNSRSSTFITNPFNLFFTTSMGLWIVGITMNRLCLISVVSVIFQPLYFFISPTSIRQGTGRRLYLIRKFVHLIEVEHFEK